MSADSAFACTRILIGIALVVSSCEYLSAADLYGRNGLLSWRVLRSRTGRWDRWAAGALGILLDERGFTWLARLRAVCGVLLCWPFPLAGHVWVLLGAFVISVLVSYRNPAGGDGSDQMSVVVLAGLLVYAASTRAWVRSAALVFIAAQLLLSYVTSGIAKLISPTWRSGAALPLILRTATYGHHGFAAWCQRRGRVAFALCWATFLFEILFPAVLWVPEPVFLAMLAGGVAFHAANAVFMGLNVFLWAFAAAYPSVIYCRSLLHE